MCEEEGVRDGSTTSEEFSPNMSAGTRKVFVKWSERFNAVIRYVGYSQIRRVTNADPEFAGDPGTLGQPKTLERLTPLEHSQVSGLYCKSVKSVGQHKIIGKAIAVSDASIVAQFAESHIVLEYERPPYAIQEDAAIFNEVAGNELQRYCSFTEWRPSTEYLSLPAGMLKYVTADGSLPGGASASPIPFNTGVVLPQSEMRITWHKLPYDINNPLTPEFWSKRVFGDPEGETFGKRRGAQGTINSSTFLGRRKGTVLFANVQPVLKISPLLQLEWDLVFTFIHNPRGWNWVPYANTTSSGGGPALKWYFVARDQSVPPDAEETSPDGHSLYDYRDHKLLFHVGPG